MAPHWFQVTAARCMVDLKTGNMIHCSAKAIVSHNFLRLKEGGIYSVKKFDVKPNKDKYRILKNDVYMLEFDGSTAIRKALVKADGFVRYPFQLQDFDGIESSKKKYLIDVTGYVTNVGRTNHLKSGSRNLDFHLANHMLLFFADIPLIPYKHHNMSTNAKLPICDIKTDHVIPNEAADTSSEVEISSDMHVTKNVVKKKQDNLDKGSESNSELFLDQLGLNLTGTIIMMLGRMWDVSAVTD
uniref:DUF223 domain-containing protein n=1 Tax=Tanacetum cinerariifolium TaxID=118510 RepID=A0A6L2NIF7_TANCI|nr:hypothetical protein [Tanacetum cinerariifolium]